MRETKSLLSRILDSCKELRATNYTPMSSCDVCREVPVSWHFIPTTYHSLSAFQVPGTRPDVSRIPFLYFPVLQGRSCIPR